VLFSSFHDIFLSGYRLLTLWSMRFI